MLPDDVRPLVDEVCAEMGLNRFDANTVEQWVKSDPSSWPSCCLGGCDPCNGVLAKAARKALKALENRDHAGEPAV